MMDITVRPLTVSDGDQLYRAVDTSRIHLTNLVWSATATVESVHDYIVATAASKDRLWGIFVDGVLGGCVTLRAKPEYQQIGYWLGYQYREQGVMTRAVALVVASADQLIAARILHHNTASRKVLLANGFVQTDQDETWVHYQRPVDTSSRVE